MCTLPHYSRFRVGERLLLTGHSHQAWPDVGFEAQQRAWLDAAEFVDEKWERAAEQAALVRAGFARLLGDAPANIALGQNTHELVRALAVGAALPPAHAARHDRRRVPHAPSSARSTRRGGRRGDEDRRAPRRHAGGSRGERGGRSHARRAGVVGALRDRGDRARARPRRGGVRDAWRRAADRRLPPPERRAVRSVVDGTRAARSSPAAATSTASSARATASCACRTAAGCARSSPAGLRSSRRSNTRGPRSESPFGRRRGGVCRRDLRSHVALSGGRGVRLPSAAGAHSRRAARHQPAAGRPARRRRSSSSTSHQLLRTSSRWTLERRGGFLAIRAPQARELAQRLRERGVLVDARGDVLRLGPAPYLRDDQLTDAVAALGEVSAIRRRRLRLTRTRVAEACALRRLPETTCPGSSGCRDRARA